MQEVRSARRVRAHESATLGLHPSSVALKSLQNEKLFNDDIGTFMQQLRGNKTFSLVSMIIIAYNNSANMHTIHTYIQ